MEELIRKIYAQELRERKPEDKVDIVIREEIKKILKKQDDITPEQYERYMDKAFSFAEIGEEEGFIRGFQYAFKLFVECMKK